jgi:hypothetical protein
VKKGESSWWGSSFLGIREGNENMVRAEKQMPIGLLVFFWLILIFKVHPVAFAEGNPESTVESIESTVNEPGEGRTELLSRLAPGISDEVLDRLLNPETRLEAAMELLTSGSGFNLWKVKTLIRSLSTNCRKSLLSGEGFNSNSRENDLSGR